MFISLLCIANAGSLSDMENQILSKELGFYISSPIVVNSGRALKFDIIPSVDNSLNPDVKSIRIKVYEGETPISSEIKLQTNLFVKNKYAVELILERPANGNQYTLRIYDDNEPYKPLIEANVIV